MALSLFKKTPATAERPALAALRKHLAVINGLNDRRVTINSRISDILRDAKRADQIAKDIEAVQNSIDAAMADAAYNREPEPTLRDERKWLVELETQLKAVSETVRRGQSILARLQADAAALFEQRQALQPERDKLMYEAAREHAATYRDEYMEAVDNLRNIAAKVFSALEAADSLATEHKIGELSYAIQYLSTELKFPTVLHPAYQTAGLTPEAQEAIWVADINAVKTEANALVQRLSVGDV